MQYDLIVIGSGPAGYVAAIRAGQTGLKTLVIDKKYIGGMCLNWGCIPTKALLESAKRYNAIAHAAEFGITGIDLNSLGFDWEKAISRKDKVINKLTKGIEYLWKKNSVEYLQAEARIISPNEVLVDSRIVTSKYILIATGSRPEQQTLFDEAIEIEDLFTQKILPERPIIYGRGANLVELAQFFALLGKHPIIIASTLPLIPQLDSSLEAYLHKLLRKYKIPVILQDDISIRKNHIIHNNETYDYDVVVNASFRKAVLPETKLDIELENGFIKTSEFFETNYSNIYAAGDVNGKSFLAHAASAQGLEVVSAIQGKAKSFCSRLIPMNIYTYPEIAQIGITEDMAKAEGVDYKVNQYQLGANGKALAEGESDGLIRILFEPKYSEVLGVQIIANNATDLLGEAGVLMELEGTIYDLARTIHAHPTVSEIYMDAGSIIETE